MKERARKSREKTVRTSNRPKLAGGYFSSSDGRRLKCRLCRMPVEGHAATSISYCASSNSLPEPAVPAYRRLRMPRKHPQVLGVDLNRSESKRWAMRFGVRTKPPDSGESAAADFEEQMKIARTELPCSPRTGVGRPNTRRPATSSENGGAGALGRCPR